MRIGGMAWSRNRFFGPGSRARESGNKRENRYKKVSDQLPPISKVRIGEICYTEMGVRYQKYAASIVYCHAHVYNN